MNIEEMIEYLQHHIAKIIKYEDGSWCNADIKIENGILIIKPNYNLLFDGK